MEKSHVSYYMGYTRPISIEERAKNLCARFRDAIGITRAETVTQSLLDKWDGITENFVRELATIVYDAEQEAYSQPGDNLPATD